jgi:biotin operon repressor
MSTTNRTRYTLEEVQRSTFYQMPKFLLEGEFKKMSNDARVLFSLLRDRHDLSVKNKWQNERGEVFLIFSRENMRDMLGLSENTTLKVVKELKKLGLMEEERQGLGRPNRIYLLNPKNLDFTTNTVNRKICGSIDSNFMGHDPSDLRPNQTEVKKTNFNENAQRSYHIISVLDQSEISGNYEECGKLETSGNHWDNKADNKADVAVVKYYDEVTTQKQENNSIHGNHNYVNHGSPVGQGQGGQNGQAGQQKKEIKRTAPSLKRQASSSVPATQTKEVLKHTPVPAIAPEPALEPVIPAPRYDYNQVYEMIKENIDYDCLVSGKAFRKGFIDEIVTIVTRTICAEYTDGYITMGKKKLPAELIRGTFFKLNMMDIEYFRECYDQLTKPVTSMESYIRVALFNNKGTIQHHYSNQVNVDMPQLAVRR